MVEDSPALEDDVDTSEERIKRKAERTSESPDLKRRRKEFGSGKESGDDEPSGESSDDNEETSERHDNGNTKDGSDVEESSGGEDSENEEEWKAVSKDKAGNGKANSESRSASSSGSSSSSSRESSASPERKEKTPEKPTRSRKRTESPIRRRPARRSPSPKARRSPSPKARRSRSPDRNRRERSRDRDRRRERVDSRDRGKNVSRERDNSRRATKQDVDMEEGEVKEVPKPLSKRELERLALLKQLEEEESLLDKFEVQSERPEKGKQFRTCPYLDTIDRSVLDFDFEKLCSVSLSTMNVYACMICGKYYQGRGQNTHAYTHSLDVGHHVYLNLQTLKFYCLPDNYEILDPSLEDIKYVLKPTYTKALISSLDRQTKMCRAFDDSAYYPGIIGLNNIKANDYCNAVLHALSHVIPLRNYFLQEDNYINLPRPPGDILFELPKRFGELMRKLWNPRAFRKHVSPHEMLQAAVHCSEKRFQITEQSDAADFMTFILNTLHASLNGNGKTSSSIIYRSFRGKMREYARKIPPAECSDDQASVMLTLPNFQEVKKEFPFLYLSMDLPPPPLYRDSQMENVIPQIPLTALLSKFNGQTEKEYKTYKDNIMKRFEILRLPEYLIITYKRFTKNQFFMEKNPTIVNFPITNVDMYEYLAPEVRQEHKFTTYDLIANVVHDGTPNAGTYRVQILNQGSQKWFQMEDLHVEEILPQVIVLAEAYIQIWRLNRKLTREQRMNEEQPEGLEPMPGLAMSNPFNPVLPPKVKPEQ